MTFINDFSDCFTQVVTLTEKSGTDDYGKPNFGSAVSYDARVIYKPTKVKTNEGRDEIAKGVVWIEGGPTIAPGDMLTLPDATSPTIMAVDVIVDEKGDTHTKVYFG